MLLGPKRGTRANRQFDDRMTAARDDDWHGKISEATNRLASSEFSAVGSAAAHFIERRS